MKKITFITVFIVLNSCANFDYKKAFKTTAKVEVEEKSTDSITGLNEPKTFTREEYKKELLNRRKTLTKLKSDYFELHKEMYLSIKNLEGYYYCIESDSACSLSSGKPSIEIRLTRVECEDASLNSYYTNMYKLGNVFSGIPQRYVKPTTQGIKFKNFSYKSYMIIDNLGNYSGPFSLEVEEVISEDSIVEWYKVKNFKVVHGILAERVNDLKQIGVSHGKNSKAYQNTKEKISSLRENIKKSRVGLPMVRSQITDIDRAIGDVNLNLKMLDIKREDVLSNFDNIIEESSSMYETFIENLIN